jgi:hypothetical protein
MSSSEIPQRDPVGELLTIPAPTRGDRLRPLLLEKTMSAVRRRRIVRRLGLAGALAACYLAGIVSAGGWMRLPAPPDGSVVEQPAGPPVQRGTVPDQPSVGAPLRENRDSPHENRGSPQDRPPTKRTTAVARADFEQIRRVSDRYLNEQGDVLTALHYYTRALKQASPAERAISVEHDSWLLMALKQAQIEEESKNDRNS